jgi:hypothetical protein
MTEQNQDFEMWEGEAKTLDVAEVDDTDISGQTITWILADEVGQEPEITKDNDGNGGVNIDAGATGEFEITLDPSDTQDISGRFYHEARLDDGSGTESVLFTGEAIIHQSGTN